MSTAKAATLMSDDRGNPTVNFHGQKRSNETHQSTTDPEARLARKGNNQPARLSDLANGHGERDGAPPARLRGQPGPRGHSSTAC